MGQWNFCGLSRRVMGEGRDVRTGVEARNCHEILVSSSLAK
jgi:hypothetical protein